MSRVKGRGIAVAIYTHPEFYPPVLNAIDELAAAFSQIWVISRNLTISQWKYPDAVHLVTSGRYISIRSSEQKSLWWKMISFFRFTMDFLKTLRKEKQEWIMCNDPIALFAFRLIRPFLGYSVKLWYHNHDVTELNLMRRFSVGYFAARSEKGSFPGIDLFTLPSASRLKFFPVNRLKNKYLIVPNYPSLRRTHIDRTVDWNTGMTLRLLYQGRVSDEHGLEEIIDFIKTDASLQLTIIGPGDEKYIQALRDRVRKLDIPHQVHVLNPVPYSELAEITRNHHVGLAVNKPVNILYSTAAMASNKIYEYAASALPILYFKNEHYIEYLKQYSWAFPTDLSFSCLSDIFREIRMNYISLSRAAQADFINKLNFETVFNPVVSFISGSPVGI